MYCYFKWVMSMPVFCKTTEEYLNNLMDDNHFNKIKTGKELVLLSNVYSESSRYGGKNFAQLNFDIDRHNEKEISHADVITTAVEISKKLKENRIPFFFENSPRGIHILSKCAFILDDDLESIKNSYDKEKIMKAYPALDVNVTFTKLPVIRLGSKHNQSGTFVQPFSKLQESFNAKKLNIDEDNEIEWKNIFREALIPNVILRSYSKIMDKIFLLK